MLKQILTGGMLAVETRSMLPSEAGGMLASEARGALDDEAESPKADRGTADMVKHLAPKQMINYRCIVKNDNIFPYFVIAQQHTGNSYRFMLC